MRIALHAASGYVSCEGGGDDRGVVRADRREIGSWETLTLEPHPDGGFALKSINGRFLCAEGSGGQIVHANRLVAQSWESWEPVGRVLDGAQVAFRSRDRLHYLSVNGVSKDVGAWSADPVLFTVIVLDAEPAPAPSGPLSRLRAERSGFVTRDARRVFLAGMSAFMDYRLFLSGDLSVLREMLAQARELGANARRVFGMAHYIDVNQGRPAFRPQDFGDRYFDAQPEFFALQAEYGQYVYWSVFPDNAIIGVPDVRGFFNREVATLKRAENTLGELTNEQDAHSFNHVNPNAVDRPSDLAFCSGSYGDIGGPHPSPWDFCDYHQPRRYDPPTHIKDACVVDHPSYIQGKGILLGEPDRYGTRGNGNVDQARQSAGACRETALGMVFHTAQGRDGQLLDAATMAQGHVFFRALVGAQ